MFLRKKRRSKKIENRDSFIRIQFFPVYLLGLDKLTNVQEEEFRSKEAIFQLEERAEK